MRANSVADDTIPEFGVRVSGVTYRDRPGAYAIILGRESRFAFVRGRAGRLFLPGGGIGPGERAEDALMREVVEEIGWSVRILGTIGRATQCICRGGGSFRYSGDLFPSRGDRAALNSVPTRDRLVVACHSCALSCSRERRMGNFAGVQFPVRSTDLARAYCRSGLAPIGASKPTTSSGPASRASPSGSCGGGS
jgi:8-oxo-dGTP pyrophosphatase MutT (NUDIX family)